MLAAVTAPLNSSPREFALLCALLITPGDRCAAAKNFRGMAWPPFVGAHAPSIPQVLQPWRRKLELAGLW